MILDIDGIDYDSPYLIPDKYRHAMKYMVGDIIYELKGYDDYVATLTIEEGRFVSLYENIERSFCLGYLSENRIIRYVEKESGDTITVINRYALEMLSLLLEDKKEAVKDLPNMAYYQPSSGRGFVNGNPIKLKDVFG